ncbi:hypothetical protein GOODEAATRI_012753 [Goodea atripinnis]|uniref:Uncharacterized protein n=1 Tax=Goodea atripinnis TaxID=208336 RepID=A0ABV0PN38_9TELE
MWDPTGWRRRWEKDRQVSENRLITAPAPLTSRFLLIGHSLVLRVLDGLMDAGDGQMPPKCGCRLQRDRSCSHHNATDGGDVGVPLILVVRQTELGDNGSL